MRFRDAIGDHPAKDCIHKCEVCSFGTIAEADVVASALRSSPDFTPDHHVLTFAAGRYYVLLITPEFVEDTDVTNTNS